jgi:hypothetical protein
MKYNLQPPGAAIPDEEDADSIDAALSLSARFEGNSPAMRRVSVRSWHCSSEIEEIRGNSNDSTVRERRPTGARDEATPETCGPSKKFFGSW